MPRLLPPALALGVVPALIALPTVTPPQAKPRPVPPALEQLSLSGVDRAAFAAASRSGRAAPLTALAPADRPERPGDDRPEVFTAERTTEEFALVGVTWARGSTPPGTVVQVRTRTDGTWTPWQALEVSEPDPSSPAGRSGVVRAGTEPMLAPDGADGVQVRVDTASGRLPADLRLELVDPGQSPADAAIGALPAASAAAEASRPTIYSRADWGADESLRGHTTVYDSTIKAFAIHHTASSNNYTTSTVASQIRAIYAYATKSQGLSDFPYNFVIDRYGRIFEGRAGGVDKAVRSAGTGGFNDYTSSVAPLGNFELIEPPAALVTSLARLGAWKLGLSRRDPVGAATLTARNASGTTSKYRDGQTVTLPTIFAHRDVGYTADPGRYLYPYMSSIRAKAKAYAGVSLYSPSLPASIAWSSGKAALTARTPGPQQMEATVTGPCSSAPVRVLRGTSTGTTNDIVWDGRSAGGTPVDPGVYKIAIRTWTSSGEALPWTGQVTVAPTASSPLAGCSLVRYAGVTSTATNVTIARSMASSGPAVVIVPSAANRRLNAAVAGPLAYAKKAPILLAEPTSVSSETIAEIKRRGATTAYVVATGAALSSDVDAQLKAAGVTSLVSLRGVDRMETAALVAKALGGTRSTVFLASASTARAKEAIAASAGGAEDGVPVLLTKGGSLTPSTSAALTALGTRSVVVVGSASVISDTVVSQLRSKYLTVSRVGGSDLAANVLAVASSRVGSVDPTTVSLTGTTAELEAAAMAGRGRLLLVTPASMLSYAAQSWLVTYGVKRVEVGGDTTALSELAARQAARTVG